MKFFDGSGAQHHAVRYEGNANAAFNRIEAAWSVPGVWSGASFMTRDDDGAVAEAQERVEATLEGKC